MLKGMLWIIKFLKETVAVNNKPSTSTTSTCRKQNYKTLKQSAQATLPNTGEGASALGILGVLGFAFGLAGFKSRKEN